MEKVGTPYFSSISIIYVSDDTHSKCITNDVFLLILGGRLRVRATAALRRPGRSNTQPFPQMLNKTHSRESSAYGKIVHRAS